MYCPECGKEITAEQKYCEHCGARLLEQETANNQIKKSEERLTESDETETNYDDFRGFVTIIIIIISIITLGFLILYLKLSANANSLQEDSVNKSVVEQTVKFTPSNEFEKYLMNPETIPSLTNQGDLNSVVSNLKDVQKFMLAMLQFNPNKQQNEDYFYHYIKALDSFPNYNDSNIIDNATIDNYTSLLKSVGLKLNSNFTYGNYLTDDKEYTYNKFAKYLSEPWKEYLRLRTIHSFSAFYNGNENAFFNLNSRIQALETFKNKYPNFVDIETIDKYLYFDVVDVYIFGKYGKSRYDDRGNFVFEEYYIKSLNAFIEQNPNSSLIPVFQNILNEKYYEAESKYPYPKFTSPYNDCKVSDIIYVTFEFKEVYDWYIYSKTTGLWKIQKGYEPLNTDEIVIFQTPHEGSQHYSRLEILNNNKTFIKNISFCEDNSMDDICLSSPAVYLTLLNSKLYLFSPATLMLSEIKYDNNNGFNIVKLNLHQIQAIFPKAEIIKMSEFKNNEHTIYLSLQPKQYLFINDTENIPYNYLQYSFSSNTDVLFSQIIPNLFQPNKAGTIIYSRYGENSCTTDNPCYYIHIKNMLDKFKH